jgi:protein involved in polysaccharide export with SLBB domain
LSLRRSAGGAGPVFAACPAVAFLILALALPLLLALVAAPTPARAATSIPGTFDPNEISPDNTNAMEDLARRQSRPVSEISSPVDPATYVVGPGDVLEVHFAGALSQTLTLVVGPEGTVFMRGYGSVRLGGLTLEKARDEIRHKVGGGSRTVQLEVELTRVRMLRVFPTGAVTGTASVELPATARVSDALEPDKRIAAGGSHRNVEVHHRDGTVEIADLGRFTRLGDAAFNPIVRDDDVLQVPSEHAFIEVTGAVAQSIRLELGPADSLRTLLALGGGPVSSARPESALFVRWTSPSLHESTWVRLADIASGAFSPPLRDGDQLFVYFLPEYHRLEVATILGEVRNPGVYPLVPGATRLSDLVKAAGGFQDRANVHTIRVYRAHGGTDPLDAELERLSRLARNQMTNAEYDVLQSRLTQRHEDYRVDWSTLILDPRNNILLLKNDVVRIEPIDQSVRVEGDVRNPGLVRFQPGRQYFDYIDDAGGFTYRAAKSKVVVTREVPGQTIHASEAGEINPGDMIFVPEKSDRTVWDNLAILIAVGAQVATIYIAVRP